LVPVIPVIRVVPVPDGDRSSRRSWRGSRRRSWRTFNRQSALGLGVDQRDLEARRQQRRERSGAGEPRGDGVHELAQRARPRVNIDYHVVFEDHFSTAAYDLVHAVVDLRATETSIEIFLRSHRVTSHLGSLVEGKATTKAEHMPASHRARAEWTPSRILEWVGKTGPNAVALAEEIMQRRPHPKQGFRSCLGTTRFWCPRDPRC
jgi:hypothetical protein